MKTVRVSRVRTLKPQRNGNAPDETSDYILQIDRQVEKFLDLKHKLIFFLITASVATIGYTLNFSVTQLSLIAGHPGRIATLVTGCVLGLLAAGFALYSLNQELISYRFHIDIRYKRMSVDELPREKREQWDTVKRRAYVFQRAAFLLLFLSVTFQAGLFLLFVI